MTLLATSSPSRRAKRSAPARRRNPASATSEPFTVRCGGCGCESDWLPVGRHGHRRRCPRCRRRLRLPMAQRVVCPLCAHPAARRLPPDKVQFDCPCCGHGFTPAAPIASASSRHSRRSRRHLRRRALGIIATVALVLGLVMLGMLGWFL